MTGCSRGSGRRGTERHDPDRLRIVAVTKAHPVEVARAAVAAGLTMLGESRVQEAEPKIHDLPTAEWHLVGRLQSNKARRAVRGFEVIHSVDSASLLAQLARVAAEEGRSPRLLLQVNVTGEAAKGGMTPEALLAMAGELGGRQRHRPDDDRADGRHRRGGQGDVPAAARAARSSCGRRPASRWRSCRWG